MASVKDLPTEIQQEFINAMQEHLAETILAIHELPQPVIAAVQLLIAVTILLATVLAVDDAVVVPDMISLLLTLMLLTVMLLGLLTDTVAVAGVG